MQSAYTGVCKWLPNPILYGSGEKGSSEVLSLGIYLTMLNILSLALTNACKTPLSLFSQIPSLFPIYFYGGCSFDSAQ